MNIAVCLKTIPDPEAPPEVYEFAGTAPDVSRVSYVLGPFEANALELALKMGEQSGGGVTAVAMGGEEQEKGLRQALALGATRAIRIEGGDTWVSPLTTARRLVRCLRALGDADLYVFGRQAGDWDHGVTPGIVAGLMDLPMVPNVRGATYENGWWVERESGEGVERGHIGGPAVLSATNGKATTLRIAKVRDVMLAKKKPIEVMQADDPDEAVLTVESIGAVSSRRTGRKVTGTADEVAAAFVRELDNLGLLGGESA